MATIKLTKTELRAQQVKLERLEKYLPTLQLKKALLQVEVLEAQGEIEILALDFNKTYEAVEKYRALLVDRNAGDLFSAVKVKTVKTQTENVAGLDTPIFETVEFFPPTYALFDSPVWFESAIRGIQKFIGVRENIKVVEEKKRLLEKELRDVSIRVNLFEKILIPRCIQNIKKIKIFLGDQQLAAVSQAKVAKKKILLRSMEKEKA